MSKRGNAQSEPFKFAPDESGRSQSVSDSEAQPPLENSAMELVVRAQVGRQSLIAMVERVRTTMYAEALRICKGNKSAAAKLLGVDRRCVQRMAAELPEQAGETAPGSKATD